MIFVHPESKKYYEQEFGKVKKDEYPYLLEIAEDSME